MAFIAEGLAVIEAALKAVELWEKLGPTESGLQTLNLTYDPSAYVAAASQIETSLDGEYEELFKGTKDRVKKCLRSLSDASSDDTFLPEERKKFGKAARMCICRELALIDDLLVGDLPEELKGLWQKHKCTDARAPMVAGA